MTTTFLVGGTFDGTERAGDASDAIRELDTQLAHLRLGNIAVIGKDADGSYTVAESDNEAIAAPSRTIGRWLGALFGTLALPLTGVGGIAASAPQGEELGERLAERIDLGFDDADLQALGAALANNHSLLVAVVREGDVALVEGRLQQLGGTVFRLPLDAKLDDELPQLIDEVKHAQES